MDLPLLVRTIVCELLPFLQEYLEWNRETPRSLAEREERLAKLAVEICRVLVAHDAAADDLRLRPDRCECGGRYQSKGLRKRALVTLLGEIVYRRRYYECPNCRSHRLPVDEAWGVEAGSLSPAIRKVGVDLASTLPFREASYWLNRLGRVSVSVSTLWRATQKAARRLEAFRRAEEAERSTKAGAARFLGQLRAAGAPGRWALAVDGLFLRIGREWREVKVAALGKLEESGEWVKAETTYFAAFEPAEVFRKQVVVHALRRGVTRKSALVIVSDGARWIEALATRYYPEALFVRDWWHAVQSVWPAAWALYGEGSQAAILWMETLVPLLWNGKSREVQERLQAELKNKPIRGKDQSDRRKAFQRTLGYLKRHEPAMCYPEYRAQGWPVGSGPVEATCKLIQVRMKRSGMNWSPQGAKHLLLLRADYCSRLNASFYPLS